MSMGVEQVPYKATPGIIHEPCENWRKIRLDEWNQLQAALMTFLFPSAPLSAVLDADEPERHHVYMNKTCDTR